MSQHGDPTRCELGYEGSICPSCQRIINSSRTRVVEDPVQENYDRVCEFGPPRAPTMDEVEGGIEEAQWSKDDADGQRESVLLIPDDDVEMVFWTAEKTFCIVDCGGYDAPALSAEELMKAAVWAKRKIKSV